MRTLPYLSAAIAAFGLIVSAPRTEAMTNSAPAGIRAAIETNDLIEPVHCRSFKHQHRNRHGWSHGCRMGVVVAPSRRGVVIRERDGFRAGTTVKSRTTIRTRDNVESRTRTGGSRVNTSIRSRDTGTGTTIRSGSGRTAPTTGAAPRGAGGSSEVGAPRERQKSGGGAGGSSPKTDGPSQQAPKQ